MFKWLQDRYRVALEGEIRSMKGELELLRQEFEIVKSNVANMRGWMNRKLSGKGQQEEPEQRTSEDDIESIRKAYGGDLPIELLERYKNLGRF